MLIRPILPVLIMCLGMSLIPLGDTAGKMLVADGIPPGFVAASRFALGALVLLPFVGLGVALRLLRDWRIWLRGALIALGVSCILTALRTEPLANVFGAFFVGPFISFLLSVVLLREPLHVGRLILLLVGFCGVLLVVRPSFGMTPGLLWAVLAGLFYGGFLTSSRWLSHVAEPMPLLLSQLIISALLVSPPALLNWPDLAASQLGWVLLSAMASMLGNLLLILAYRGADATILAPFVYTQLASATLLGWFVFGDWPDDLTLVGLAVVVVSGVASLGLAKRR